MDYFSNDPRGVSEHTQNQIDEAEYLRQDLIDTISTFKVMLLNFSKKHSCSGDRAYIEAAMQYIEDAFHKPITDLKNRIGKE